MPSLLANGTLNLTVRGGIGFVYSLEASQDLVTWLPLHTNLAAGLKLEFQDTDAPKFPQRFYRARVVRP